MLIVCAELYRRHPPPRLTGIGTLWLDFFGLRLVKGQAVNNFLLRKHYVSRPMAPRLVIRMAGLASRGKQAHEMTMNANSICAHCNNRIQRKRCAARADGL